MLKQTAETTSPAYNRDRFEHWIDADGDGCNTRYEVLIDESTTPVTVGSGCSLTGGTWVSPYDGVTATTPAGIEIDHVVALAEAWRSGAFAWTDDQRRTFANDLDVPYALTAASTVSNQSKGDKDPAEWLPTNTSFTCEYVTSWALVKYRWSLAVDPAEYAALTNLLSGDCGAASITLPTVMPITPPAPSISFTDISGHVFQSEITWMANNGISRGWQVGPSTYEFRPQNQILRGEMAAFLYRLAGQPAYTPPVSSPFIDVPTTHVFYKEISWLASTGISKGWVTPNGTEFRAEWSTTREVMAAFLHRFEGSPAYAPSGASPFRDVQPGIVFYNEILWLAAQGISTGWDMGYGCRDYRPAQNVLRSEMAAFIYRMENGGTAPLTGNTCSPPPSPLISGNVTAGAFCAQQYSGWYGYTSGGTLMQCKTSPTESRLRWR
ncbi:hypothetical protein J2Y46_002660 [Microbacterium sp. BE35]|uniref:S-layer homology domain-containing protein n=1 Tax=Microbacterium sp. BE35 TaxID=2817773 RepID=UPI0028602F7B|nr:S-layer homology domain-containing protein [Microbacterium sp. BE35]MDR7189834.1 hypothetical protein [Microbacterium sp. BE35]